MAGLWVGCERAGAPGPPAEGTGPAANDGYVESSDDVHLYYRVVGTGGDTVIVLHGGPGFSMEYFAEDLVPLAERHTLIFYDQRGAGRSTLVSDSTLLDAEWWAEDLEAVRRYFDLGRVTLLGHSWGASVAALYLTRYPRRVERLLVVGGTPLTRWELTRAFEELAEGRGAEARDRLQRARDVWLSDPGDAEACRAYYTEWFVPFFSVSRSGRTGAAETSARGRRRPCGTR
jgi:proline iminopeptidase